MKKKFGIVKRKDLYLLRKLTYPHFKAYVDLNKPVPEIKDIIFLENCSPAEMADAIKEASNFIDSYQPVPAHSRRRTISPYKILSLFLAFHLSRKLKFPYNLLLKTYALGRL